MSTPPVSPHSHLRCCDPRSSPFSGGHSGVFVNSCPLGVQIPQGVLRIPPSRHLGDSVGGVSDSRFPRSLCSRSLGIEDLIGLRAGPGVCRRLSLPLTLCDPLPKKKVPFFPLFVSVFPGRPYSPAHRNQQPPASPVNNWWLVSHLLQTSWWGSPLAAPRLPQGASQITRAPTPPPQPGPRALARASPRPSHFRNNGSEHARV